MTTLIIMIVMIIAPIAFAYWLSDGFTTYGER